MNFNQVYEIVAQIPKGKVLTYGSIAMMLNRPLASRAVAMALRKCPSHLHLPAHRVVNKSGSLAPEEVFGGEDFQRKLLKDEGVIFLDNGKIDMRESFWET